MTHLDRHQIRRAVEAAERHTSAEIVVSIAPFFIGRMWPAARRAFDHLGIARTRARNGVLVFVVPSRHSVVVLGDVGIESRIDAAVWQRVASGVATAFARGNGTAGLAEGIGQLGAELAIAFPRQPDDVNELPDQPRA